MNRKLSRSAMVIIVVVGLLVIAPMASACPSCYGAAQSSRFDGMNAAILTMIGITGTVLAGFVTFIISMRKRIRRAGDQTVHPISVNRHGKLEWSNS